MPLSSSLQADVCLNNKLEKKLDCRSQIPCEFVGRKVFFGIQKQMNESHKTKEMMCFCVCVCVCVCMYAGPINVALSSKFLHFVDWKQMIKRLCVCVRKEKAGQRSPKNQC